MSAPCDHRDWIEVIENRSGPSLRYGDHLTEIVRRLETPRDQYPSFALFCGNTLKRRAIGALFPRLYPRRGPRDTNVHVQLDLRTRLHASPTIIVDAAFPPACIPVGATRDTQLQQCKTYPLKWTAPSNASISETVLARLFNSWADNICVFVDDCGGPEVVAKFLRSWAALASHTQYPPTAGPHILLVGSDLFKTPLCGLPEDDTVAATFASIQLFSPNIDSTRWTQHEYLSLKERVQQSLQRGRNDRQKRRLLFSALHQQALFARATIHLSQSLRDPFDSIFASRAPKGFAFEFGLHIQHVLTLAQRRYIPTADVHRVVASALVVDALPAGAHVFHPDDIFARLYDHGLLVALSKVHDSHADVLHACTDIHKMFCAVYENAVTNAGSAPALHVQTFQKLNSSWSEMQSSVSCFCCFKMAPEHVAACGHGYCENCVRLYGRDDSAKAGIRDVFQLDVCIICGLPQSFSVRLKPPTGGIRLLSIDGGGIKGIVPLKILASMQELLGDACPIQDLFDLCMGTSAGGLVALKVFAQDAKISDATQAFQALSKEVFQSRDEAQHGFLGSIIRILKTVSKDELYDSTLLDSSLLSQFGSDPLFHCSPKSGARVGVVATSVQGDTSAPARVLATYNGCGTRSKSCGYRLQRAENSQKEVMTWQAARATTAAPGYFKPAVTSLGAFQDGCMFHNNPVNIALWESRILWPTISKPDVVLSLGTGSCRMAPSPVSGSPNLSIRDAFPFRVARSFWSSMDGQSIWRDLWNKLDDESRKDFFRLTVEFPDHEPAMDDSEAMDSLAQAVQSQPDGVLQRHTVLMALLVASLFFELNGRPQPVRGGLLCKGFIRCRTPSAFEALLHLFPHGLELFNDNMSLACWLEQGDICGSCQRVGKPVQFVVAGAEEMLKISVKWDGLLKSRFVGAMPQKLQWFIEAQGLDDVFKQPLLLQSACSVCDEHSDRKRKARQIIATPSKRCYKKAKKE